MLFSEKVFSSAGHVLGANSNSTISEFSVCKTVTNSNSSSFYIPTGITADWNAFILHPPPGITISTCLSFAWSQSAWSACSSACNGGSQTRTVTCIDSSSNIVADSNCSGTKPSSIQSCNAGIVSDCSNAPNICSGSVFSSTNGCNIPTCSGTKAAIDATWGAWSSWSSWNDPGPAACNASCLRAQSQTRSRVCNAGNGCGTTACSSPTTAVGGIDTQPNSQNITCNPGEGACPANVCNNSIVGKYCAGFQFACGLSVPQCQSICASYCFSKSCTISGQLSCALVGRCN